MNNNQVVATLPAGYRAVWDVAFPHSGDGFFMANSAGQIAWIGATVQSPGYRSSYVEFVVANYGSNALQSQVRMPTARMAFAAITEEPTDRCMCVVDADGNYVEFVMVTITRDELGALYTVHYYELGDGERLVDSQTAPPMRPHTGADGLVRPRWDGGTSAWVEGATAVEIAAWEADHPAPESQAPSLEEDMMTVLVDHEARLTAVEEGVTL